MPRLVAAPTAVVDLPGKVRIDEFFGNASCDPFGGAISVAHVKASAGFAEDWQTPAFDEYVLVLKGSVSIEHSHGQAQLVKAGQAVYLAKGERVRWVFPEDAEYVPICMPAFSPENCFREEDASVPRPAHDQHTDIYHLVQKPIWEEHKAKGTVYYPPTYEQDGFTHATADPSKLLGVANHFYKDVQAEWLCLRMTRETLAAAGLTLKFEAPAPVGSTAPLTPELSGGERFPHIYAGIPSSGVVVEERKVVRDRDGTYLSIESLC